MLRVRLVLGAAVAVFSVVGYAAATMAQGKGHHNHDHTMTLTVKGMCCEKESAPLVKEIQKLKGVEKVKADTKKGTVIITPTKKLEPVPREVWEAAERAKVQPIKLATAHETFTKKPKR